MASANITMGVKGIDKTGAAFNSVRNRAKATGAQIRAVMGGALAAAGAYLSLRSVKSGIDELGNLSDLAMKAGTSVETLTKSALAFQVAGLNMPVEALARSFQFLKKQTGDGGMENFYKTAQTIAAIEDPAKRGAELVKNFGRAGIELQPLIDGGEEAIRKMQLLTDIMPGVSDAVAAAGDAAADSLKIFGTGAHNLFLKVVGNIIGMWSEDFPGGIRAGALNAINWLETFAKKAKAVIALVGAKIGALGGLIYDAFRIGPSAALETFRGTLDAADADFQKRMANADQRRAEYVAKLREVNVDDLANALGARRGGKASAVQTEAAAQAAAERAVRITNDLIEGGSNRARRLSVLGPEYQNEQKKQTDLLKKIAENTAQTAENTDGDNLDVTDLN